MNDTLTGGELVDLVRRVFEPRPDDRGLLILVDLPDEAAPDNPAWAARREMAADWAARLAGARAELGLERVSMAVYRNVGRPNQELPPFAHLHEPGRAPGYAAALAGEGIPFDALFAAHTIVLAPTEFSATAPLKLRAKQHGLRAATMPGFVAAMIPALRLDWVEVDRRCRALKEKLDAADAAHCVFDARAGRFELTLDLRFRQAHASGGLLREPGVAGNLPSGETYIVPYEGERSGEPSRTSGVLPLELDGEFLTLSIERNRVVAVLGDGPAARAERREMTLEPAYSNVAELGLGLLRDYGVRPIGELLLDEKLGLHIAFGRSDHFGGQVGPKDWHDPARVAHIDRVLIPELMPGIVVRRVDLVGPGEVRAPLMRDGRFV